MTPAIALDGIDYAYPGTQAGVSAIDLEVRPGELLAVIGPSGCGKSTLLKLIAGFIGPDKGSLAIGGEPARHLSPRQRNVGIVFQSYALFPHMTASENVAYPLKLRGMARGERRATAMAMLAKVGLAALAGRRPAQLSGGQQQRVALARALVFKPRALLLDEPLSALDAALRLEMRDEIRRLQREHSIATLHVTHDQEEALSLADRVAVMQAGRILQIGTPREIYERPATAAVAGFVGQANLWSGRVSGPAAVATPLGVLVTLGHGRATGDAVAVLVRPERVALGRARDGVNTFSGTILRDRYLGANRRFDLGVAGITITGETADFSPIDAVHIPPSAVQILAADPTTTPIRRAP